MTHPPPPDLKKGQPVFAMRDKKRQRAWVQEIVNRGDRPYAAVVQFRDRFKVTVPIADLIPAVDSAEGAVISRDQRDMLNKGAEHLRRARRIAEGKE